MSEQSTVATRVTLTYAPTDERVAEAIGADRYRSYLRRAHGGRVSVGDEWDEFVSCGCGTTRDVTLRVESTDGGEIVDEGTEFEFAAREA